MNDTIKARFVGGPWHNRVVEVRSLNAIEVPSPVRDTSVFDACPHPYSVTAYKSEAYLLCRFVSEGGSPFCQYIHQSLMNGTTPRRTTYTDPPLFVPDVLFRQFTTRLVMAACGE